MPDRLLGRSLGKYRVTRLLGLGGFAWVYEAVDSDLELPVALKVLRPDVAELPDALARFRREATTAARLRHPRIVTVRDIGTTDGYTYVAMDLHRSSLAGLLAHAPQLAEATCIRIGIGVAEALACAHANGVVHRDIKPDNILLDDQGDPVVGDFGLARAFSGGTALSSTGQVLGTPQYFSPEQARGLELDGRSDIYALGVMLYRCATGRVPFEASDWYAIARQHIEVPAPPLRTLNPAITEGFESIVMRLLAKAPDDRPANGTIVAEMLAALPTAPTLRSRTLTPATVSEATLVAPMAPVDTTLGVVAPAKVAPPAWRRLLLPVGVPVLIATAALLTWQSLNAPTVEPPPATSDSLKSPAIGATVDAPKDSTADTTKTAGGVADTTKASVPVTAAPRPTTARLELSAPDSAELRVDGRVVGRGLWSGDVPATKRIALRASLADANCATARRDSTIGPLDGGARKKLTLEVRTCVPVHFEVVPRDARLAFRQLDTPRGAKVLHSEVRADSMQAFTLPAGRYEVTITGRGCVSFPDTLLVQRSVGGGPFAKRYSLICS